MRLLVKHLDNDCGSLVSLHVPQKLTISSLCELLLSVKHMIIFVCVSCDTSGLFPQVEYSAKSCQHPRFECAHNLIETSAAVSTRRRLEL